jgi:hypothetical protein
MKKWLICFLLLALPVQAADVTLNWTAPTENTDGTPLIDLEGYNIYYGLTQGGPYPTTVNVPNPTVESYDITGLSAGTYYFVATAYNTEGTESEYSNETSRTLTSTPNPPFGLTVSDLVAYSYSISDDKFLMIPVGTVPIGTPCDSSMSANGLNLVLRENVEWASTYEPPVVFAACS